MVSLTALGLLRCISPVDSGRHFLQTNEQIYGEQCPLSTYFKSPKSPRRTRMLEAFEQQSYQRHCTTRLSQGIDYLTSFPELDAYTVEVADGHFIDHACHTEAGANGKAYAAGFIDAMNLRNGLLRPLCLITNGTRRNQEIPALRNQLKPQSAQNQSQKPLTLYAKAVTDYAF